MRAPVVCSLLLGLALPACGVSPTAPLPSGRIIGRVELGENMPLGDCQVLVEGLPRGARCDSAGNFDIGGVPAGRRDLRVVAQLFGAKRRLTVRRVTVGVNGGFLSDVQAIRVAPSGSIGGRVRVKEGAPPFSLVAVPLFNAVTEVNANTGYLLKDVPPGIHEAVLTADGAEVKVANISVLPGKTTTGVDFELSGAPKHSVKLSGRAERQDGKRVGLRVELVELLDGKVVASATTNDEGGFTLEAPSGIYQVRARDPDSSMTAIIPFQLLHGGPIELAYTLLLPLGGGDLDEDGLRDDQDTDADGDGVANDQDVFRFDPAETTDSDGDGLGDVADLRSRGGTGIDDQVSTVDTDQDLLLDFEDNCPELANKDQKDSDGDGVGDPCDNCPGVANPGQEDSLGDGTGDLCRRCIEGQSCIPADACHQGKLACTGHAVCADIGQIAANGTPCGQGQVCNNGKCGPCSAGELCSPTAVPCNEGKVSCKTGVAVCEDTKIAAADGMSCGADLVCKAGKCVPCKSGESCPSSTLCRMGKLECGSGDPICAATQQAAPDGEKCGTQLVCKAGQCVPCAEGQGCQPAGNLCHLGALSCATGTGICNDTGKPAPDGSSCGVGLYCKTGACVSLPNKLAATSGDAQTGAIGATLGPVLLKLTDGAGKALVGEKVSFQAPPGGSVTPASALTDTAGQVTFTPKLGPAVGAQTFMAINVNAPPATITATATPLPAGKSYTAVNVSHVAPTGGDGGVPGPGAAARIGQPEGLAVHSDGTIFFADVTSHRVRLLKPDGTLENLAGTGGPGSAGDFGPAINAQLYAPTDVTLDEKNSVLYIAEYGGNRVRAVDLSQPARIIRTYAGGGAAPAPTFGDGGLASAASLAGPRRISMGPDGALYIGEEGHDAIRRVDPTTKIITTLVKAAPCTGGQRLGFNACAASCAMAWDSNGSLFFVATLCGSAAGYTTGILRRSADGNLHHVAGKSTGINGDGADARNTLLKPSYLAFDGAGNLLVAEQLAHRVRRIDGRSYVVATVAGTGVAGNAPELSDASKSPLNEPVACALAKDDLLVSERLGHSLRRISSVNLTTATPVSLAITGAATQNLMPAQLSQVPFQVKLAAAGLPLAGVLVSFEAGETAVVLTAEEDATASDGLALVSARPGIALGSYTVTARFADLHGADVPGSPATFTLQAQAPAAGTIFTAANVDRQTGVGLTETLASTTARLDTPKTFAVASDGTVYLTAFNDSILRLGPRGELAPWVGAGAGLNDPVGLWLDEPGKRLLVADRGNHRIRSIDLQSKMVSTVAGGGTAGPPGFGDGGPATQAALSGPSWVALDAGGNLLIFDALHDTIRRVDASTKVITTLLKPGCAGSPVIAFNGCSGYTCGLALDAAGTGLFVSGSLCGSASGSTPGILHLSGSGALTHVAGQYGGSSADGTPAAGYLFASLGAIVRSGADLYVMQANRILKLATTGGAVTTVAGTAIAGWSGDYGPAASAQLSSPFGVAMTADGHLLVADTQNDSIRMVW